MSAAGWVAVGLLGGAAAGARFLVDHEVKVRSGGRFPVGILVVNLCGAFALGMVAGAALDGEARVIVAGSGIGSFTTFSTWILDSERLGEAGYARLGLLNIALSVVAGLAAVTLGHWLGSTL